jgi:Predicted redox protein, regulator of disulfide bond formation
LATDANLIDARGLKCPLPVLRLEKRLSQAASGTVVTVIATDPMAKIDIPLYCRQNGYTVVQEDDGGAMRFVVTKSPA